MPEIIRNIENVRAPKELVGNSKYENWKIFKKRWNNYTLLTKLSGKANDIQVALFENSLGDDAMRIYESFDINEERKTKDIIEEFDKYISGTKNIIYERYIFNIRNQNQK